MKATLIFTALLGAAIASPVAIANVEAEKRDLEPRQVSGVPIQSVVPNGSTLGSTPLGNVLAVNTTQVNLVINLTTLFRSVLSIVRNLETGFGSNNLAPTTPTLPDNPVASIPKGTITLEQARALIDALVIQVANVISIGQNLPANPTPTQLRQSAAILTVVQQVLTSITTKLPGLTSPTGVTGAAASSGSGASAGGLGGLGGLQTLLAGIPTILATITGLLGGSASGGSGTGLTGLTGLTSFVGGLLGGLFGGGGLNNIIATLPGA